MTTTSTQPSTGQDEDHVYFYSGDKATYRKVAAGQGAFTEIPTINVSKIDSPQLADRKQIAKQIHDACTNSGFFYLTHHGIPSELLQQTFSTLRRFFALDQETKMSAHVQKNAAIRGYEPMLETRLDPRTKGDIKEAFTMGDCVIEPEQKYSQITGQDPPVKITRPQNIWPDDSPWFREGLYEYYTAVFSLAMKLVNVFALAFDLEETAFQQYFKFPITGMRALHYPPVAADEGSNAVGLGAHTDFSWLTMVLQDSVPALEVLNKNGEWIDAPPKPDTLVCNVGQVSTHRSASASFICGFDLTCFQQYLERQTNGRFVATVHRVRNKTSERRYSLPFFLTPDPTVTLPILECCMSPGVDPEFEPIRTGDLYIRRVLPARPKHPTSIKYSDVPASELSYDILYAR